tara:strand:- start:1454 stop:2425 length:972 start_codon:yes stop_codon:yes gene_type:complete
MRRVAFITGITGQDGSYLTEFLLEKGYTVVGLVRRVSTENIQRISHIESDELKLVEGDITDLSCLIHVVGKYKPDEVYNLAAQSFVHASFDEPIHTSNVNALGALNVLEAVRLMHPKAKVYQASTSEMFGKVQQTPQTETTPFHPRSPYGVSKTYAHYMVQNYRESYDMYACGGILFNHESPRRGTEFVTRKITQAVARISHNLQDTLRLGNLDAQRDWGYAPDYVEAMWLMLQQDTPQDFVISTGETRTVREFCEIAFKHVGLCLTQHVVVDPKFYRPAEVDILKGDNTKAKEVLGWAPRHTFEGLVTAMVDYDMKAVANNI